MHNLFANVSTSILSLSYIPLFISSPFFQLTIVPILWVTTFARGDYVVYGFLIIVLTYTYPFGE
jgi:hypothetical protein